MASARTNSTSLEPPFVSSAWRLSCMHLGASGKGSCAGAATSPFGIPTPRMNTGLPDLSAECRLRTVRSHSFHGRLEDALVGWSNILLHSLIEYVLFGR